MVYEFGQARYFSYDGCDNILEALRAFLLLRTSQLIFVPSRINNDFSCHLIHLIAVQTVFSLNHRSGNYIQPCLNYLHSPETSPWF